MRVSFQPWPHQIVGKDMLREAYRAGKRAPILVIPTGGGKTPTACEFIRGAVLKGRKIIVLVHRLELLLAMSKKLDEFGVAHGLISPDYKQTSDAVQVASVQTLVRRLHKLPWKPDIFCIDEAHLSCAPTYQKIFAAFPDKFKLGLTATPKRLDQKGLGVHCGGHYDCIVEPTTAKALIAGGYLVRPIVYAPSTPDLRGVRTIAGDYDHAATEKLMDKPTLVGDAVTHYLKLAKNRPAMAFCVSIAHAEHVAEQFRAAGVRAKAVSGQTSTDERLDALKALGENRLDLVANCALYIEGVDQPAVSCIILLSPTKSLTRYRQSVGRGMRRYPLKENLIILDHAGCCYEHGFPDDPYEWTLDGKEKKKRDSEESVQRMKLCQKCFAMNPLWRSDCEQCHAPFEAQRAPPKQTEGELVEITDAQKEIMRQRAASERRYRGFEEAKAQTLEELIALGKSRKYPNAEKWARIRFGFRKQSQRQAA